MTAMAPNTSRNPSPATNQYAEMATPARPVASNAPNLIDSLYQHLIVPQRPSSEKHDGPAQASTPGTIDPGAQAHMPSFTITKDSPVTLLMQSLAQSGSGFLKLIIGIVRLIPGLAKN